MTLIEKQQDFKRELSQLLSKYKAEISLEDFGRAYMRNDKMVVTFGYDERLVEENGSGIIPDLVIGTFIS